METILIHQLQTLGWLQIPEFGKNQQKHSLKVNWLDETYNKEYWWGWERGSGWGTQVNPWLIHVNV